MKKMLRNQKGFSLVELLIVIAIMGVLAALAFSMFAGILGNSRRRADERTADQIAKVLTSYILESGDADLAILTGDDTDYTVTFEDTAGTENADLSPKLGNEDEHSQNLVLALQHVIVITNNNTKRTIKYGPYLSPREGDEIHWDNYKPTWSGHEDGYNIIVFSDLQKADVVPVPKSRTGMNDALGNALNTGVIVHP